MTKPPRPPEADDLRTAVLIVENSELLIAAIRALLEEHAHLRVVGVARTADEAVAAALRELPDVITMDLGLGETSGLDATRRIKAVLPHTRIVAVTLHDGNVVRDAAAAAGVDAFLHKSALADELVRLLAVSNDFERG